MENSAYMDSVSSARAMLLTDKEALEGNTTISLETDSELNSEQDTYTYVQENFPEFLRIIRYLKKEDQELLLSYYLLSKTQTTLALIHKSTQTVCSFRIRMAIKTLCAFIMMGEPTAEKMKVIFEKEGLEDSLENCPLSECVSLYAKIHSFQKISEIYHIHRPSIRRAMSKASKALMECPDARSHALGAYVHSLIDKASPVGVGYSKRKQQKQGSLFVTDSDILGQFKIDVMHPDFDKSYFVSRANK